MAIPFGCPVFMVAMLYFQRVPRMAARKGDMALLRAVFDEYTATIDPVFVETKHRVLRSNKRGKAGSSPTSAVVSPSAGNYDASNLFPGSPLSGGSPKHASLPWLRAGSSSSSRAGSKGITFKGQLEAPPKVEEVEEPDDQGAGGVENPPREEKVQEPNDKPSGAKGLWAKVAKSELPAKKKADADVWGGLPDGVFASDIPETAPVARGAGIAEEKAEEPNDKGSSIPVTGSQFGTSGMEVSIPDEPQMPTSPAAVVRSPETPGGGSLMRSSWDEAESLKLKLMSPKNRSAARQTVD